MKNISNIHLDATGLICPEPLMRLKQAVNDLQSGDSVTIDVTDVHAELDFEIWCERFGHHLELKAMENGVWIFVVTKGN